MIPPASGQSASTAGIGSTGADVPAGRFQTEGCSQAAGLRGEGNDRELRK
ncbi:MAG: hypothetical protein IKO89_08535 [Bacteroidales bacterium]|nr:hypothetical protein [Bacteroidales bacterium]